ncbi:MAG: GNAT family N-acetyltransferase [candidate division FCPU426 bacterium]
MEIRPPNKLNYPAVASMLTVALGEPWDAEKLAGLIMADPLFDPNLVLMAREKGEVLGFLSLVLSGETAWIKLIAVAPHYQRKGLATEMLERSEERGFGEGARVFRAGFGPPPLFFPGVPEGAAAEFFKKHKYSLEPGGVVARLAGQGKAAPANARAAKDLLAKVSPEWWTDIEERLTFTVPRCAMSADHKVLCVADPGSGIGPLFEAEASDASIAEAVAGALDLAQGSRLRDLRPSSWWKKRFELDQVCDCFEFKKDLRGATSA